VRAGPVPAAGGERRGDRQGTLRRLASTGAATEGGAVLEVRRLTKRFGATVAVDDLSFTVRPGRVTGFLGPNGAGKTTTMRVVLGLDRPTSGTALVDGKPYASLRRPLHEVGALLDAKGVHPGRSARAHLTWMAQSNGIPARRVDEVLDLVGLTPVANRRAGGFSLGMGQRLGIAAAMLGDPGILLLDEPVNGLDPEGIVWVRNLLKHLALQGRSVFVSSHLMSEMALTADHVVVIGRGRLIADEPITQFVSGSSRVEVLVRSPQAQRLRGLLVAAGAEVSAEPGTGVAPGVAAGAAGGVAAEAGTAAHTAGPAAAHTAGPAAGPTAGPAAVPAGGGAWRVRGLSSAQIGELAAEHGVTLHELSPQQASLEEVFMQLTQDALEFAAEGVPAP
jgi:ABC-2 type transport system ATP-binding protein